MPTIPPKPSRQRPPSWLSVAMAAVVLFAAVAILFVLSLGAIGPVVVIGGMIFAMVGFHYVVWGWWLGGIIRREEEEAWDES